MRLRPYSQKRHVGHIVAFWTLVAVYLLTLYGVQALSAPPHADAGVNNGQSQAVTDSQAALNSEAQAHDRTLATYAEGHGCATTGVWLKAHATRYPGGMVLTDGRHNYKIAPWSFDTTGYSVLYLCTDKVQSTTKIGV